MQWPLFKKQTSADEMHETPIEALDPQNVLITASVAPRFFHETEGLGLSPSGLEVLPLPAEGDLQPLVLSEDLAEEPENVWAASTDTLQAEEIVAVHSQDAGVALTDWESPLDLETDREAQTEGLEAEDLVMWLGEAPSIEESGNTGDESLSWMNVPPMDPEASLSAISGLSMESLNEEAFGPEKGEAASWEEVALLEPVSDFLSGPDVTENLQASFSLPQEVMADVLLMNAHEPEVLEESPWEALAPESVLGVGEGFSESEGLGSFDLPEEVPVTASSLEPLSLEEPSSESLGSSMEPELKPEIKILPPAQASYSDMLEILQRETRMGELHLIQNSINRLVNGYFKEQALEKH